jgi:hypothetical protein
VNNLRSALFAARNLFFSAVTVKGPFSFAAENSALAEALSGRRLNLGKVPAPAARTSCGLMARLEDQS